MHSPHFAVLQKMTLGSLLCLNYIFLVFYFLILFYFYVCFLLQFLFCCYCLFYVIYYVCLLFVVVVFLFVRFSVCKDKFTVVGKGDYTPSFSKSTFLFLRFPLSRNSRCPHLLKAYRENKSTE